MCVSRMAAPEVGMDHLIHVRFVPEWCSPAEPATPHQSNAEHPPRDRPVFPETESPCQEQRCLCHQRNAE